MTTKSRREIGGKPNPKQDYVDKQFIIGCVPEGKPWRTVTRGDYEGLPDPMCAWRWTDEQMKALADAISREFDYEDIYNTWKDVGESEEGIFEELNSAWWHVMETSAINLGMRYYEDFTEEEMKQDEEDWKNFTPINNL